MRHFCIAVVPVLFTLGLAACKTGGNGSEVKEFGDNQGDIFVNCVGSEPETSYDHARGLLPASIQIQFNANGQLDLQYGSSMSHVIQAGHVTRDRSGNYVGTKYTLVDNGSASNVVTANLAKSASVGSLKGDLKVVETDNQGTSVTLTYTCKGEHDDQG